MPRRIDPDSDDLPRKSGWTPDGNLVITGNATTNEILERGIDPITGQAWQWQAITLYADIPNSPFPMITDARIKVAVDENGVVIGLLEFVPIPIPDSPRPDDD